MDHADPLLGAGCHGLLEDVGRVCKLGIVADQQVGQLDIDRHGLNLRPEDLDVDQEQMPSQPLDGGSPPSGLAGHRHHRAVLPHPKRGPGLGPTHDVQAVGLWRVARVTDDALDELQRRGQVLRIADGELLGQDRHGSGSCAGLHVHLGEHLVVDVEGPELVNELLGHDDPALGQADVPDPGGVDLVQRVEQLLGPGVVGQAQARGPPELIGPHVRDVLDVQFGEGQLLLRLEAGQLHEDGGVQLAAQLVGAAAVHPVDDVSVLPRLLLMKLKVTDDDVVVVADLPVEDDRVEQTELKDGDGSIRLGDADQGHVRDGRVPDRDQVGPTERGGSLGSLEQAVEHPALVNDLLQSLFGLLGRWVSRGEAVNVVEAFVRVNLGSGVPGK